MAIQINNFLAEADLDLEMVGRLQACCQLHGIKEAIQFAVLSPANLRVLCADAPEGTLDAAAKIQVAANNISDGWALEKTHERVASSSQPAVPTTDPSGGDGGAGATVCGSSGKITEASTRRVNASVAAATGRMWGWRERTRSRL